MTDLPSIDYLRECLSYEPETGKLYWRKRASVPSEWNTRWAGKEAFTATISGGYRRGLLDNKAHKAHRVCWAIYYGEWPQGEIDHVNHDRGDNRIENLRVVAPGENHRNKSLARNNRSGVVGVRWHAKARRWYAQIRVAGKCRYLGLFSDFKAAVAARKEAEAEHNFHSNHGRKS